MAQPNNLAFLASGKLIMGEGNGGDTACDVMEGSVSFNIMIAALLDGYRGQDELEVVLHAMLHLTK
jgi:hypothetical protein